MSNESDGGLGSIDLQIKIAARLGQSGSRNQSSRLMFFFVLHPLADEVRTGEQAEVSPLSTCQIHESNPIQFLQLSQIDKRPQGALDCGRNELVEVTEMTLR
jgi:hypothetical protein